LGACWWMCFIVSGQWQSNVSFIMNEKCVRQWTQINYHCPYWKNGSVLLRSGCVRIRVRVLIWTKGLRSRSWSRKESEVFGWSRSRIPNKTWSWSRIFLFDSDFGWPVGSFFTSHSQLRIPVEMVQFLLKVLLNQIFSCCVPRFPLILTAKFYSLYVNESESEILESRSRKFYLRLRKSDEQLTAFENSDLSTTDIQLTALGVEWAS